MFNVEVVPADNERVRATGNTSPSDFSCCSEEQDVDEINQFEFKEDAELSDLEETLDSSSDFTNLDEGFVKDETVAGTFSATVRMYYVYVYVAVILLQICSGPSAL